MMCWNNSSRASSNGETVAGAFMLRFCCLAMSEKLNSVVGETRQSNAPQDFLLYADVHRNRWRRRIPFGAIMWHVPFRLLGSHHARRSHEFQHHAGERIRSFFWYEPARTREADEPAARDGVGEPFAHL